MSTKEVEERRIANMRLAFEHGEIEAIVGAVRKIESVMGRHSGIVMHGEFEVAVEWHDSDPEFDAVFGIPGASGNACDLIRHDVRMPQAGAAPR